MRGKGRKSRKSIYLIGGGLLLVAAALCLTVYNIGDNWRAGWEAGQVLAEMEEAAENGGVSMPAEEDGGEENEAGQALAVIPVDGNDYIGVLEIPDQELILPVMEEWSYPKLRIAPCRYMGSAKEGDLIIAGHNYDRHFGRLKNLQPGEPVIFMDAEGNRYEYEVQQVVTLQGTDVEEMEEGEWDLTLFTCTVGGQFRVTVRCGEKQDG